MKNHKMGQKPTTFYILADPERSSIAQQPVFIEQSTTLTPLPQPVLTVFVSPPTGTFDVGENDNSPSS